MLNLISVVSNDWNIIKFLVGALVICCSMLFCGFFCGERTMLSNAQVPFESGIDATGDVRLRFSFKFYLLAMFFVIFDAEVLYLYIWSIVIRETGWIGFVEATLFIIVLLLGLFYLMRMNVFDWVKEHREYRG